MTVNHPLTGHEFRTNYARIIETELASAHLNRAKWFNRWLKGGLVLAWLYLEVPELSQLVRLVHTLSAFNIILIFCSIVAITFHGVRSREQWSFSWDAPLSASPLMVVVGMAIASTALNWWLDLDQLSLAWFILGSYGVMGLFCQPRLWKQGIPFVAMFAGLMLVMAAEFTDVGHLVRTGIAEIVEYLLKPLGLGAISSEDILVFNTGIASVDIPCSGFKNIEIGSLFFIAASFLSRKHMGIQWCLVGLMNSALLIMANVARIFVLVVLVFGLEQRPLADMLHVPLGLFGFVTVCLVTLYALKFVPKMEETALFTTSNSAVVGQSNSSQFSWKRLRYGVFTLGLLLSLIFMPQPEAQAAVTFNSTAWDQVMATTPVQTQAIDLNIYEQDFFARYPGVVTQKQRFHLGDVSGSVIAVASPTWEAHHAPELCFSAIGSTIDHMEKRSLIPEVTGRWLSLNQGQRSAAYWFQSPQHTTDHYFERVWREIRRQDPQWTMVSIQFDQSLSDQDADVQTLVDAVHGAIAAAMSSPNTQSIT